jgi:hypothetical protein
MSRLEVPIRGQTLWMTGDVILWAQLDLLLKDGAGAFLGYTFLVDTGTQITTFPAFEAKQAGLPIPANVSPLRHRQTGLEVRSGLLRFRVAGMDATEYVGPCLFLGDPNIPLRTVTTLSCQLLQPLSLLNQLHFDFDKDAKSIGTPHGIMTVEKKVP